MFPKVSSIETFKRALGIDGDPIYVEELSNRIDSRRTTRTFVFVKACFVFSACSSVCPFVRWSRGKTTPMLLLLLFLFFGYSRHFQRETKPCRIGERTFSKDNYECGWYFLFLSLIFMQL